MTTTYTYVAQLVSGLPFTCMSLKIFFLWQPKKTRFLNNSNFAKINGKKLVLPWWLGWWTGYLGFVHSHIWMIFICIQLLKSYPLNIFNDVYIQILKKSIYEVVFQQPTNHHHHHYYQWLFCVILMFLSSSSCDIEDDNGKFLRMWKELK